MKKLVSVLILLQLISLASAVDIQLTKESYSPNEILQAEIYGNFIDGIELENIHFYRERNVPVIYDILEMGGKYLLYALLPSKEGNYTLKIKDTRYGTDTGTSTADIVKKFKIQTSNETALTINPGFLITREDFYIEVKANKNTNIDVEFLEQKQTIPLIQNKAKKIYFSIEGLENYTEADIKVGNYLIPVFIYPKSLQVVVTKETNKFRFNPLEIEATILEDESYSFQVSLLNLGRKNISNIEFYSNVSDDLDIRITPDFIPELGAGKEEVIDLVFTPKKDKIFSGDIFADSENMSAKLRIDIEATENKSEIGYEGPVYVETGTCAEIGGKMCPIEEKCDIPLELATDGYCCKGECIIREEDSSTWIYGVIIIVAVLAGIILFSFYMKKKQKPTNPLRQREKNYEQRMSGEVRGSLTRT